MNTAKILLFVLFFILSGCSSHTFILGKKWNFEPHLIEGWEVLIDRKIGKNKKFAPSLKKWIKDELILVNGLLPKQLLKSIQQTKIWVSNETHYPLAKGEEGLIVFHTDAQWLKDHFFPVDFVGGIQVINPEKNMERLVKRQVHESILLHEIINSYYFHCLEGSLPQIQKIYKKALASKKYDEVEYVYRKSKSRAYGMQNVSEYFAELSEAYLYKNDFWPFKKDDLKKFDKDGYEMVKSAWNASCSSEKFLP